MHHGLASGPQGRKPLKSDGCTVYAVYTSVHKGVPVPALHEGVSSVQKSTYVPTTDLLQVTAWHRLIVDRVATNQAA